MRTNAFFVLFSFLTISCAQPARNVTVSSDDSGDKSEDATQEPYQPLPQIETIPTEEEVSSEPVETKVVGPLEGTWGSGCVTNTTGSQRTTFVVTGTQGVRTRNFYSDGACSAATHTFEWSYSNLVVGVKVQAEHENGDPVQAFAYDQTYASVTMTLLAQSYLDEVEDRNDDFYVPDDDLVLNTPINVSGRTSGTVTQPGMGGTEYGAIVINPTSLSFPIDYGLTPEDRIVTFADSLVAYNKQI
ncbi:MAG: hypothetical protein AB7T49_01030 [Oligoflexales bacterium]